ncbi:hypothetical protein FIV42_11905 [Persicimonas caeni]|uniref:Uncharacterized protein n=1 Tax=Persicimonas caeni TaxID=2292766 RepID=A0A4Y6PT42_PERCE|nr:hypothetical protein [Persicimonas caeni]QDG51420.1 hypothetical protein FIV42_11905 [Persicimonas caeni]QED32641.1 hypothetical protein FRD00_11900 [Persicimonas caeni]
MTQWEALALTLALEVPVALLIAWLCGLRDDLARVAAVAVAASLVTHPIAWYLAVSGLADWPFWQRAAVIEAAVVAAETVVYAKALKLRWPPALGVAFTANAVSFAGGLLLVRLL